ITRRTPDGDERRLAALGRGQFFGEVGILAETRRMATVRAVDEVEVLGLTFQTFQETLERSDRSNREFAEIVKDRIEFGR
ncbi:MAG TPA: cyclic nucleotide-binding domain-containing protein, partial [Thermoleophilaceae bacterium]|nr:cyclic nucleotide-binding domain-containing protein [Thermoleophilaceae bacterium]